MSATYNIANNYLTRGFICILFRTHRCSLRGCVCTSQDKQYNFAWFAGAFDQMRHFLQAHRSIAASLPGIEPLQSGSRGTLPRGYLSQSRLLVELAVRELSLQSEKEANR